MIIPTNDLINYEGDSWDEYLKKLCLYDIFEKLCEEYSNEPEILSGLIKYIIWAYSIDSNKITLRKDWVEIKKDIFKASGLPKFMQEEVIYLKVKVDETTLKPNVTLLQTIKKWLALQDGENFSNWCMLNDLISEMRIAANSPIRKSTGEIDYEQKRKCAEAVLDLLIKKDEVEQKFIQNNEKLKEASKEISQLNGKKTGSSFGFETMLKENK